MNSAASIRKWMLHPAAIDPAWKRALQRMFEVFRVVPSVAGYLIHPSDLPGPAWGAECKIHGHIMDFDPPRGDVPDDPLQSYLTCAGRAFQLIENQVLIPEPDLPKPFY